MKPRVVIQRVSDGQYRKGSYSWTDNIDLARVFRSDGIAKNHRSYDQTPVRYVPVKLTVIE